jgi:hypothetical protein
MDNIYFIFRKNIYIITLLKQYSIKLNNLLISESDLVNGT